MPSFPDLLRHHLAAARLTPAGFSRKAGMVYTYGSALLVGRRPPPAKHVRAMADTLGLTGAARREFFVAAALAHLPAEMVAALEAEGVTLGRRR